MKNKNQLTEEEISIFCMQAAYLLKAGVPLYDGLSAGMSDMKNKRIQQVFSSVGESIMMQNTLEKSLRDTDCFPEYVCSMVGLGEVSGRLEDVFLSLSSYYDKEKRIKNSLKQAVTYPAALFFIMSLVVSVLVFKVLPMFARIFAQLGGSVSSAAESMMNFGKAAGIFALIIILAIMAAAVFVIIYGKSEKGKVKLEETAIKMPFIRDIVSKSSAVRFASAMSLALSSGSCLDEAMTMASDVMENSVVREKIIAVKNEIYSGISFGALLEKVEVFPAMFSRMAGIGMKTGNLDEAMKRLSGIYADELEDSVSSLIGAVEPILVGIIALVVGMILVSVLLPLTGVMAAIG
ncbi:MAG: type II secretion system F family protein [Clostridia bacterium]|nr:type II secretion system F family protein [Clostridia bacterium]